LEEAADPVNLLALPEEQLRHYRGGQIGMIFQEPMSSLNPVYSAGFQLIEAIRQHQDLPLPEARRRAINLLQEVKLLPDDEALRATCLEEWAHRTGSNSNRSNGKQDEGAVAVAEPSEREILQAISQQKHQLLERYPHEFSGGQIQRIMIAMAMSCNPSLLIADEPTTALDVTVQAKILDLLRELRDRRGMSIVFITHDLGLIADIADTVAVMYQGKIVEYGSVWEIFSNPQHPYTRGLLSCRPRPDQQLRLLPTIADFMGNGDSRKTSSSPAPASEPVDSFPTPTIPATPASPEVSPQERTERLQGLMQQTQLLSVKNLDVGFPVKGMFGQTHRYMMAVKGVSFDVYPGETLGLVGESGCGKTTLARTLLSLIKPMSGQIQFAGQEMTTLSGHALRRLRRDMQIIFQDPFSSLDPRISIGEAIMEPLKIHGVGGSSRDRLQRVSYLLDRVGLDPTCHNRYPHEFSGGQRQRVCIARALALNPRFIICDESVSALDVSVQAQVLNLLKELQTEFNLTYIFISHDLSVVKFMSDRIMVMNQGSVEEIGPAEEIYRSPQKPYTQKLIDAIPVGSLEQIRQRQEQRGIVVG
jgi:peptide/nickel transport system ATP-binding protein